MIRRSFPLRKRIAVVYTSRQGSTRQYAQWVAHECSAKLFELKEAVIDDLCEYDIVVFGSCVYNGLIDGISFIKNNRDLLRDSRLFIFTVGLTQPGDETAYEQVLERNFTPEEREGLRFYHFLGVLDFGKMSLMQRLMMRLLKKSIQRKPEAARSQLESYVLKAYGGRVDFTNRACIKPLVEEVLALAGSEA